MEAERKRRQLEQDEAERQAKARREAYLRKPWTGVERTKTRIEKLIGAKQPKKDDGAAVLLGKADEFGVSRLYTEHSRKQSFIRPLETVEPPPQRPGPMW